MNTPTGIDETNYLARVAIAYPAAKATLQNMKRAGYTLVDEKSWIDGYIVAMIHAYEVLTKDQKTESK